MDYLDTLLAVDQFLGDEPEANGLVVRSSTMVSRVAVAVNTSDATIQGAIDGGADLMVVHHPSWTDIDLEHHDSKMARLQDQGISLYAAHASLDAAPEIGNSWVLAEWLGLAVSPGQTERRIAPLMTQTDGGFAEFVDRVESELGASVEAHEHAPSFANVAIVTGAGGDTRYLASARKRGADTFLTGEGSMYTRMYAREAGLNLVLASHHATEAPGIIALGDRLTDVFDIPVRFIPDSADVF